MKNIFKRGVSLLLSLSLAFSLMAVGVSAEEFADMPDGWSREAVASAVENGLLRGNDGKLDPAGLLTRAQLATVIVRAFGATAEADLSGFTDVKAEDWYYSALARAKGMAVMNGTSGSTMSPDRPISRQEVFVLLARALKLADGKAETLNAYKDAESVGAWAVGGTAAMVSAGYVSGSDGYLLPTANITREQFAQILYNIFSTYYQTAGVYTNDVNGSLLVNAPDVVIKDAKIAGDLVVGDGVGEGDLTLENVSIGGRLVVRGGGVNSIHIKGSAISSVVIGKENGAVRVVADSSSKVERITIADGKDDVIIEGKVNTIAVENEAVPVILKNATVDTLQVNGDKTEISLVGKTDVKTLDVAKDTEGVKLNKEKSTTVGTLNTESDITVAGEGKISNITGSGKPTNETGDEVKPTTTPSGGSSGGGGHSHSYAAEWSHDETHHWHAATCSHTNQKSGYAEHTYTITSDTATCTVAGEKTETCVCGVSRTVASPAKDHDFTGDYLHDADGHWHKCTRCDATDTKNEHTWNDGVITTPATCTGTGVRTFTCSCGETKTEAIPATGHTWGGWSKVDDTNHKHTCSVCQGEETADHTWDGDTCSVCGAEKPSTPDTPTGGYTLAYEENNDNLKLTCSPQLSNAEGKKYTLCFYDAENNKKTSIFNIRRNYADALGKDFAGTNESIYTRVELIDETNEVLATLDKSLTVKHLATPINITDITLTENTTNTDKWDATITADTNLDQNASYIIIMKTVTGGGRTKIPVGDGFPSKVGTDGKIHTSSLNKSSHNGEKVNLYLLKVTGSVDENGNATLTYTPMGTAYQWTVPAEEQQQVSAIKGLSLVNEGGELRLTIEKPENDAGIERYRVYLSNDGGNTWSEFPPINASKDWTYLFCHALQAGTYNKIKVVSTPGNNSNYTKNEYVVDCSITVNVSADSNAAATFTRRDDESGWYDITIAGLSYVAGQQKWWGTTITNDAESPSWYLDDRGSMYAATATTAADAEQYEGYYKIREYSGLTVDGMNASVDVKETEWQRCSLET